MKKILIAGAGSYIGCSFEKYLQSDANAYCVDTVDMVGDSWTQVDLTPYESILFVAGIVHVKNKVPDSLYYEVNRDLPVRMAEKAKSAGVRQFIFLSTMSVYGSAEGVVDKQTLVNPQTHYGISKYQAEQALIPLSSSAFQVYILRPPMVYGKGCKGNYPTLAKFAKKFGVFPNYTNQRSMIYVENLCFFIKQIIDENIPCGVWCPQNKAYVNTCDMVKNIAEIRGKKLWTPKFFNPLIHMCRRLKIGVFQKCFGSYCYAQEDERELIGEFSFEDSIWRTEGT